MLCRVSTSLGLLILGVGLALGQNANSPYVLRTFAGSFPLGDGGPATQALLSAPHAVATDSSGNVYVLDPGNSRIRKFAPGGTISTVIKLGVYANDMKLGADGNFYLTATGVVLKVSPAGAVTVLAGNGTPGFSGDGGPAVQAQVGDTKGIALDSTGNIYFAEPSRIREITLDGNIQTVAGTATSGYDGDNKAAISAQLNYPTGLAIDSSNSLYIADSESYRIRKVKNGTITTLAGNGTGGKLVNGPATATPIGIPGVVAVDVSGNVFVSDISFNEIYRIGTDGNLTQVAGAPTFAYSDGAASSTYLIGVQGLAPDGSGGLYMAETGGNRIRQLSGGSVRTIAGRLHYAGDGGPATSALFGTLVDTVADAQGNVYVLDSSNFRIRKVAPNGTISTFAGNGLPGNPVDGTSALSAALPQAISMTIDGQGNLYLGSFQKIHKISAAGVISTFAGDPGAATGFGDGGPATKAQLNVASALAADSAGNIYVGDCCNSRVRKISPNGTISAFAGPHAGLRG
jgi:trimeric autotransporter adhesin